MRSAYHTTKACAKERGVPFKLTLAEFAEFANRVKLLTGRGRTRDKWHIDRIDNSKGYQPDNLQILTCSENSQKGALSRGLAAIYQHRCQLLEMGFPDTSQAAIYRPAANEVITASHVVTYDYESNTGCIVKNLRNRPPEPSDPF